jgi:hypothetical protein
MQLINNLTNQGTNGMPQNMGAMMNNPNTEMSMTTGSTLGSNVGQMGVNNPQMPN